MARIRTYDATGPGPAPIEGPAAALPVVLGGDVTRPLAAALRAALAREPLLAHLEEGECVGMGGAR